MMALTQKGWLALKDKTVQVQANTHHTNAYTNTHTRTHARKTLVVYRLSILLY